MSWNAMSWTSQSWSDLSWSDQSWAALSWSDQSWSDLSWSDQSWSDLSWSDQSYEDANESDAISGTEGYALTPEEQAAANTDPDLEVPVDPVTADTSTTTTLLGQ
jgi:hypothetical protein